MGLAEKWQPDDVVCKGGLLRLTFRAGAARARKVNLAEAAQSPFGNIDDAPHTFLDVRNPNLPNSQLAASSGDFYVFFQLVFSYVTSYQEKVW